MWKAFDKKQSKEQGAEKAASPAKAAAEPKKAPAKSAAAASRSVNSHRVFLKPIVSEKTAHLGADNWYAFKVAPSTNKVEIKKAFLELYRVRPVSVRISNTAGKYKRSGKTYGLRAGWKKALIRLPKGSKVNIFEGV